ncbi:hypothetical protein IFM12275_53740 [Nocardia sputorum]|uniref:hypothetical protein n=1 Tax=Nocardia sputorum TaxID=2984338 RepID=UPI0024918F22|nr:hypothetical protein [Nocardia sputorum]BDT95398.1 hypothetical protein IFM12275_53740 [Nocardia sputorum]
MRVSTRLGDLAVVRGARQFLRAEIADVLIRPVGREPGPDTFGATSGFRAICSRQVREVFQSSRTSWSSKIIDVGTVDISRRISGSAHDS